MTHPSSTESTDGPSCPSSSPKDIGSLRLDFIADPGHGWLQVEVAHLRRLGIAEAISAYSYLSSDGCTAYLEEDCDAACFLEACRKAGIRFEIFEQAGNSGDRDSFIRQLPSYPASSRRGEGRKE